jgi:membrane protease YdiL (CAAX protease family)
MDPIASPETETAPDFQPLAPTQADPYAPVAPYWHTAIFLVIVFGISFSSAWASGKAMPGNAAAQTALPQYISTILMQWILFGIVVLGLRLRKTPISEVMGKRWASFDDFLLDVALATGVFVVNMAVRVAVILAVYGKAILSGGAGSSVAQQNLKAAEKLIPHGPGEIAVAMLLALTAGIVEEFVFRGYLQRQFMAMTKNAAAGILITSLIFTGGHLYQGSWLPITFVAVMGFTLSLLAYYRRNLRPGIMLHFGQDAISLLFLGFFAKTLAK